jgi:hypothetical protein
LNHAGTAQVAQASFQTATVLNAPQLAPWCSGIAAARRNFVGFYLWTELFQD